MAFSGITCYLTPAPLTVAILVTSWDIKEVRALVSLVGFESSRNYKHQKMTQL